MLRNDQNYARALQYGRDVYRSQILEHVGLEKARWLV